MNPPLTFVGDLTVIKVEEQRTGLTVTGRIWAGNTIGEAIPAYITVVDR